MSALSLQELAADLSIIRARSIRDGKPDLTELQRRSEQRRQELAQYAGHQPTATERRALRIMLRAVLIQQRDRERGLL